MTTTFINDAWLVNVINQDIEASIDKLFNTIYWLSYSLAIIVILSDVVLTGNGECNKSLKLVVRYGQPLMLHALHIPSSSHTDIFSRKRVSVVDIFIKDSSSYCPMGDRHLVTCTDICYNCACVQSKTVHFVKLWKMLFGRRCCRNGFVGDRIYFRSLLKKCVFFSGGAKYIFTLKRDVS